MGQCCVLQGLGHAQNDHRTKTSSLYSKSALLLLKKHRRRRDQHSPHRALGAAIRGDHREVTSLWSQKIPSPGDRRLGFWSRASDEKPRWLSRGRRSEAPAYELQEVGVAGFLAQ